MNHARNIVFIALSSFITATHILPGGQASDEQTGPRYIDLSPDAGMYKGVITDGMSNTPVTKISFAGDTVIDGIKKERDNSANQVSMAEIASIHVIDPLYESDRYKDQKLSRTMVRTTSGASEELLFPRDLLICAQSTDSGIKKSWYLHSVTGITIQHGLNDPIVSTAGNYQPASTTPQGSIQNNLFGLTPDEFDELTEDLNKQEKEAVQEQAIKEAVQASLSND